jgi:PAS domain-containing protein
MTAPLTPWSRLLAPLRRALSGDAGLFSQVLGEMAVATFVLDRNRRVVIWNTALAELTGVATADVIGTDRHWEAFYVAQRPCLADLVLDGNISGGDYAVSRSKGRK